MQASFRAVPEEFFKLKQLNTWTHSAFRAVAKQALRPLTYRWHYQPQHLPQDRMA